MQSREGGFDREKRIRLARRKKLRGRVCEKKLMVKKDKTRHKSEKVKEKGSKAVPSTSCRAVVALTVG